MPEGTSNLIPFRSRPFGPGEQAEFYRLLRGLRDRAVILHSLYFNVPLVLRRNVRQIAHFYDVLTGTGEFRTILHRFAYSAYVWSLRRHRACILAQSDYTAIQIRKHHPFAEVIVCPPGYRDYLVRQEVDLQKVYGLQRPYFLCIGLNKPRKNLDGLLRAYRQALQQQPDIRYDLAVGGPIFNRSAMGFDIRAAVESDALLRVRVRLLGFIPEEHLQAVYGGASLYVVPSHIESGYSYPALEALTAGTPVLLNRVDMYNFASEGHGVAFFDGSVERGADSLDSVLARMLAQPEIGRVDPAQSDVLARFSWGRVKDVMRSLYQRA